MLALPIDFKRLTFKNLKTLRLFSHLTVFLFFSFFNSVISQELDVQAGKKLFNANCAACHKLNKKAVGPALKGVSAKYDREWLYSWIKNSAKMIKSGDAQAVAIWEEYNKVAMNAFPQLSNSDIDNILAYTDYTPPAPVAAVSIPTVNTSTNSSGFSNNIILAALSLVFVLLVVMLFLVQKTLKRIAIASGVDITPIVKDKRPPIWQVIAKNQFLIFLTVIGFLLSSAYFVYGYLMQIGIDQGYMPVQPIHYSHKIHSGANQIECKYCHSSARASKHSGCLLYTSPSPRDRQKSRMPSSA